MSDSLAVLYEDDHVLAVAKATGEVVVPGRGPGEEDPLSHRAGRHAGGRIWVVHRLDRESSGVVLFAKDAPTHRALSLAFERREVEKTYLALASGVLEGAGEIDRPLREFGSGRVGVSDDGKPARTRWSVRESFEDATLLEVEPVTGRRHQIRVHLYAIGHPILGDPRYGESRPVGGAARLMLHALEIGYELPGEARRRIRCEPPGDFERVLASRREAGGKKKKRGWWPW